MPPAAAFIDQVHGGRVGRLRMLSTREHRFPFLPKVDDWNRFARNTGGTMVEKCCHFFDLMRLITPGALRFSPRVDRHGPKAVEVEPVPVDAEVLAAGSHHGAT